MYRLNLVPKTGTNAVTCSQHDTGLRMFQFEMYKDREAWQIDADTVTMEVSNGASITGTFTGNIAVFDCNADMTANAGDYFGKIKFEKGADVLHSASFAFNVERKP